MKRAAVIVPEYNEKSRSDLASRLDYFNRLANNYSQTLDVIIVDDASTDDSKEEIARYVEEHNPTFKVVYRAINGQKIGAIVDGVKAAPESIDTIILTDFDSSIPEGSMLHFDAMVDSLHADPKLGGFALRVDGEDTKSWLGYIQDFEYTIGRAFDGISRKERKTRCIAGAGGIWKRKTLEEIFPEHSGRHNGDDMELTAMAMRHGYDLTNFPKFVVETKTPADYGTLLKQRTRWELGALETYTKEWKFYAKTALSAFKLKRFGILTALQIGTFAALPFTEYVGIRSGVDKSWDYFALYYATDLAFISAMALLARKEIKKSGKLFAVIPLMPVYRIATIYPSRTRAFYKHMKNVAIASASEAVERLDSAAKEAYRLGFAAAAAAKTSLPGQILKSLLP